MIPLLSRPRTLHKPNLLPAAIAAFLLLKAWAMGAQVTSNWNSAFSTNWTVDSRWSNVPLQGAHPNNGNGGVATYDAIIAATGAPYTVRLDSDITVENITLNSADATLLHASGTAVAHTGLAILNGTYRLSGTLRDTNLSVSSAGAVLISGGTVRGGSIAGGGLVSVANVGTLDAVQVRTPISVTNAGQLDVRNGLTLADNASVALVSTGASVLMQFRSGAQLLGGTGEVVFGGNNNSNILLASGDTTQAGASRLTIGPGILVHGPGSGSILSGSAFDSVVNQGTIRADTNGKIITIGGNWSNTGLIQARNGGTVTLGGTFTTAALGVFDATGGVVRVNGILDNTGSTLVLTAATGSLTLASGRIRNGTVTGSGGAGLVGGGILEGVNLAAGYTVPDFATLTAINGLSMGNGARITLASTGRDAVLGFGSGMQTLGGTGEVFFGGTGNTVNTLRVQGSNTTAGAAIVTIGPGITIHGTENGTVRAFFPTDRVIHQGTIRADTVGRTISIVGNFTQAGTVEASGGGALAAPDGYTQTGGVTRVDGGTISAAPASVIDLQGGALLGTGVVDANVRNGGVIAPGLPLGALTISRDLSLTASSQLRFEIGGPVQGIGYDFLSEGGATPLTLSGTLAVSLLSGYDPTGLTFTILTSNAPLGSGTFSNVAPGERLTTSDGLGSFRVDYGSGGSSVVLSQYAVPEPGTAVFCLIALPALVGRRVARCEWADRKTTVTIRERR